VIESARGAAVGIGAAGFGIEDGHAIRAAALAPDGA
jgi:hypothetical protein